MKILHVVRQYAPAIGGLETYVKSMSAHQIAAGHECHVLTLNKVFHGSGEVLPDSEMIDGVSVRRVPFKGRQKFFLPLILPSYFRQFDIVHVHNTDVFFDYLSLIARVTRIPCFATTHGGFFHTADFSLIKKLYFNIITRFSIGPYRDVFAISQNDYNTFSKIRTDLILLPNAVEPLGTEISQEADFVYIGRLSSNKNIPDLLKVFAALKHGHAVPGSLHVIGPEWDVKLEDLKALAISLGIQDAVIFHGAASTKDMRDICASCGYFVSASGFEGFGMSMIEGMSIGLIPLLHQNQSFKDLVAQSGVGLCMDFQKHDDAARTIAHSLPLFTARDRQAAQDFSRRFSWEELTRKTLERYSSAKGQA